MIDLEVAMHAVVTIGAHQYRVAEGDRILVDRLPNPVGETIRLEQVAIVVADGNSQIGLPTVQGAVVEARVSAHLRGKKLEVFQYRPKKRFRSRTGFRAELTALTVGSIHWPGAPAPETAAETAPSKPPARARRPRKGAEGAPAPEAPRSPSPEGATRPAAPARRKKKSTSEE
jgi:large subunit ribosomal protein L21